MTKPIAHEYPKDVEEEMVADPYGKANFEYASLEMSRSIMTVINNGVYAVDWINEPIGDQPQTK